MEVGVHDGRWEWWEVGMVVEVMEARNELRKKMLIELNRNIASQ